MNIRLAEVAEAAVKAGVFETHPGYCLRFCREVDEALEGTRYDALFRGDGTARDATAARAGHRFLARGFGFLRSQLGAQGGLQPGDMLVKTQVARNRWGDFSGHIGIVCCDGKRVAENSSTSKGRVRGALGFRSLVQFGEYDIVVRLPSASASSLSMDATHVQKPASSGTASGETPIAGKKTPTPENEASAVFTFNHEPMPYAVFERGRVMVPLVDFLHAFGYETLAEAVTSHGGNIQGWKAAK